MKALLLKDTHQFELIDMPVPEPGEGQALVRVLTTCICGSEVHGYHGKHFGRKAPAVMGHEVSGVVEKLGAGASSPAPGTRVAVMPQTSCGVCEWCRQGSPNLCPQRYMLGFTKWPGSFEEYFVIPATMLYPIADYVPDQVGALMEPLSVGLHAVRRAKIKQGDSVLVFGSGAIGIMTMLGAREMGAEVVIATDLYDFNLKAAKAVAATHTHNARSGSAAECALELTNGRGVDHVFLAADAPGMLEQAVAATRIHGNIIVIAMYDKSVPVPLQALKTKEQCLLGSVTFDATDFARSVELAHKHYAALNQLVTHTFTLEQAEEAFQVVDKHSEDQVRVAFKVSE